MINIKKNIKLLSSLAFLTAASGVYAGGDDLPSTMIWSSYGPGSGGYAEAAAIADAFGKEYGTRIRILPSGSGVGRLQPIFSGRADFGFIATEGFFASEGSQDFAKKRWGPQTELRVLAARPESAGVATAADANIKQLEDLKGKRLAVPAGNPSINVRCEAILSFVGYSLEDLEVVNFADYNAAARGVSSGLADALCTTTTPGVIYELAESPRGLNWIPIPSDNTEGWERLRDVAPIYSPGLAVNGAGLSEESPVEMLTYPYPSIVASKKTSDETVYAMMAALESTFDMYKSSTSAAQLWNFEISTVPPMDTPFHDGAIKYLKEHGYWSDKHQDWQDNRLKRLNALEKAWSETLEEGDSLSDDDFEALWEANRLKTLNNL